MVLFSKKKRIKVTVSAGKSPKERKPIYDENGETIPTLEFMQARNALVKPLENSMVSNAARLQSIKAPAERLPVLQAIISDFYSLKMICEQAGPEYAKYFSKMWEHCHNSRNPDFTYVERFETELNEIMLGKNKKI